MRLILFLFLGLINLSETLNIIQDQCSCSCCIGYDCIPIDQPNFYIPLCIDDDTMCVTYCKMAYPFDCGQIDSQTFAVCISNGSKIFQHLFNVIFISLFRFLI